MTARGIAIRRMSAMLLGWMLAAHLGISAQAASIDLTEAGRYNTPGSATDVVLIGHYAYVADGSGGLRVLSFADPGAPVERNAYPGTFSALAAEGNYDAGGAWAYVANAGRFSVIAIMHGPFQINPPPAPPSYFNGEFGYCAISGNTIKRIVHSGDYAIFAGYDAGLGIVDVSDVTAPIEVGHVYNGMYTYTRDVAVSGNYVYAAQRLEGMHGSTSHYLSVINISNPASPSEVNTVSTSGTVEGLAVSGQYLYVADGTSGLRILSLSTPTAPAEVGHFATAGAASQVSVSGTTAYVTEAGNSLRVLDVSNPSAPKELGFYTASGSVGRVWPNGSHVAAASGGEGARLLTFMPPSLNTVSPDRGLAGQPLALSLRGLALGDVVSLKLQNAAQTLTPASIQVSGTTLSAFFAAPQPAGLYDLVLSINNVLSQGTLEYSFKNRITLATPSSGPQAWRITDLGKAGNPALARPASIAIADADRDQKAEVYVAGNDRMIVRFKHETTWSITYLEETPAATYQHLLAADGNQDRDWELYAGSTQPQTGQILMDGAWQGNSISSNSGPLALGDANHDGVHEIYLAGNTETGISLAECAYNGSVWITRTIEGASYQFDSLAVGDGNHDLADEVYAANHDHYLYQYRYNGTSWSRSVVAAVGGGRTLSLLLNDFDRDGKKELYAANQDGSLYRIQWNGSAWSSPAAIHTGSVACNQIVAGDADNDGQDEIYGAGQDGHAYRFKPAGSAWQTTDLGHAGSPLTAIAVGDGDNNFEAEVYGLGENAHLYQFQAFPSSPTPTPTPVTTVVTVPDRSLKVHNSQINPDRGQRALIRWSQPTDGPVTLRIFTLLGDSVITLEHQAPGVAGVFQEMAWDGRTAAGSAVGSGIYIVTLEAPGYQAKSKICVVK